jgi:hypothetical protein
MTLEVIMQNCSRCGTIFSGHECQVCLLNKTIIDQTQLLIDQQILNNRLIKEQSYTNNDAFNEGYAITNFCSRFLIDEDNSIYYLNKPYLTDNLQRSFEDGYKNKIKEIIHTDTIWLSPLLDRIKKIALSTREKFLLLPYTYNNDSLGSISEKVEIKVDNLTIDFGILKINLSTKLSKETGEVYFFKKHYKDICGSLIVNKQFDLYFNFDELLATLNEPDRRSIRLKKIQKNTLKKSPFKEKHASASRDLPKKNDEINRSNTIYKIAVLIAALTTLIVIYF